MASLAGRGTAGVLLPQHEQLDTRRQLPAILKAGDTLQTHNQCAVRCHRNRAGQDCGRKRPLWPVGPTLRELAPSLLGKLALLFALLKRRPEVVQRVALVAGQCQSAVVTCHVEQVSHPRRRSSRSLQPALIDELPELHVQ